MPCQPERLQVNHQAQMQMLRQPELLHIVLQVQMQKLRQPELLQIVLQAQMQKRHKPELEVGDLQNSAQCKPDHLEDEHHAHASPQPDLDDILLHAHLMDHAKQNSTLQHFASNMLQPLLPLYVSELLFEKVWTSTHLEVPLFLLSLDPTAPSMTSLPVPTRNF